MMFWRSVVGKLAITILLLVSFVLFILTILLLKFFEDFHIQEAEKDMVQAADKISAMIKDRDNPSYILDTIERMKVPSSKVVIALNNGQIIMSDTTNEDLLNLDDDWFKKSIRSNYEIIDQQGIKEIVKLPNNSTEIMVIGTEIHYEIGDIFIYQSLDVIDQTRAETTRIILLAAGIAIILTTIFVFFLSTRITSPLIKIREAVLGLAKGEFNTKIPILTNDEIGELGIAFNKIGKELNFHINALRHEKELLTGIVRSMAGGVITINRDGDMIVINPPAQLFLDDWFFENNLEGYEKGQLPEILNEKLQKVILCEQEVLGEISLQGRSWMMIMTPLYDQQDVRGAVVVIRDITEERRLDKLRKDFVSNVSHELRTPISLLQGYSEAIMDDIAESKEEKNELAEIINEESLRMGRLVNELLDLGSMEAGHIELNKEYIKIGEYVDRIRKKFTGIALKNNISLTLTKNIIKERAYLDADRIEQVFTNLIGNALDHTYEHGNINISLVNNIDFLYVEITDNGRGIPEEDIPFIFERFYKADKSRTKNSNKKGTGLGLAIAKNIIDVHAGVISVKSKIRIGTTFSFKIPHDKTI